MSHGPRVPFTPFAAVDVIGTAIAAYIIDPINPVFAFLALFTIGEMVHYAGGIETPGVSWFRRTFG